MNAPLKTPKLSKTALWLAAHPSSFPDATATPDLASYDWILVSSSAGKDSQAMLDLVVELATRLGVRDRVMVLHCDLGRVEWKGTAELAEEQAKHYGLRFLKVSRSQDLLAQIEARGMFPDAKRRFCTSDHKRAQVRKVMTALAREKAHADGTPVRILDCMGIRGEESPARGQKPAFARNAEASNKSKRLVDTWYPIHTWRTAEVWARIKASGVRHHPAYDLGMPRLSCCFCVLASKSALFIAGKHNPELLDEYCRVEEKIGHTFKRHLPLVQLREEVRAGVVPTGPVEGWCM
jgi:3'-phosphoadenosine 5'-phosphosulfate sulfotransferase (PAPS reductase)/FAD synthetase